MNPNEDYYHVLGIQPQASEDEIKKAYKKLARRYHPDLNPRRKSAEERFKRVQAAYEVLSDPVSRQDYDQSWGNSEFNGGQTSYGSDGSYSSTSARSLSEILNQWKSNFTDDFSRQRKLAVIAWGLCLVGLFLPTSWISLSYSGRFYEVPVGQRLLWITLPLIMIWVGSGWSNDDDWDSSALQKVSGILMLLVGWGYFARLIGRRFLGPLIYDLFG